MTTPTTYQIPENDALRLQVILLRKEKSQAEYNACVQAENVLVLKILAAHHLDKDAANYEFNTEAATITVHPKPQTLAPVKQARKR